MELSSTTNSNASDRSRWNDDWPSPFDKLGWGPIFLVSLGASTPAAKRAGKSQTTTSPPGAGGSRHGGRLISVAAHELGAKRSGAKPRKSPRIGKGTLCALI